MIKRYVNLPDLPVENASANVPLVASAAKLQGVGTSEWWVEPASGNTDLKYLSMAARAKVANTYVQNEKDKFKNTLTLPQVGGDKYTVKCSKKGDRSSPMQAEQMETWRKIFYTVHWMNQDCKKIFDGVKGKFEAAFESAFIKVEKAADSQTLLDEPRSLRDKPNLPRLYKDVALTNKPFHLRIVVANDLYYQKQLVLSAKGIAKTNFNLDTGGPPLDVQSATDNTSWIISARVRVEPSGAWIDLAQYITRMPLPNKPALADTAARVDLSPNQLLTDQLAKGKTLEAEVTVNIRNHVCGYSNGNFIAVRIKEPDRTPAQVQVTVLQTFTHEVGHAFQQVVQSEDLFDATTGVKGAAPNDKEDNTMWHTDDFGGRGPHCHTNASKVADRRTTSQFTYSPTKGGGPLCTMFFRDDPKVDADGKFCASCLPRLKRVSLEEKKMILKRWNLF